MVLVIDTSSVFSGLALLRSAGNVWEAEADEVFPSGRGLVLADRARELTGRSRLCGVAVALGPGSFTGIRVGVSYGVGLAMGLRVPLYGLGTLELAAARARVPATGLSEAGRGRVYFLPPGGRPGVGAPAEVPNRWPGTGWLREATADALGIAGVQVLGGGELDGFARAAARAMDQATPLGYGRVRLRYMSSPGRLQE
jgi:tRNA A37 threonylcarbamoyladenosine modification protein TsaB